MEVLGTIKINVFYIKCQKLEMGFFFYYLSFANFFHFSDENLACEQELNNFVFIN
jgi:hypothetical protein